MPHTTTANPIGVIRGIARRATAGSLLAEQLAVRLSSTVTKRGTHAARVFTSLDLFRAFKVTGFQFPGEASHGYGASGVGGGVEFGVDIGKLVLPGYLTAEASATLRASGASETLIAMIRQSAASETGTVKPICLFTGKGTLWSGSISLAAEVGVKAEIGISATGDATNMTQSEAEGKAQEEAAKKKFTEGGALALEQLAVSACAKANASLRASYGGDYMALRDPSPNWYPSHTDSELESMFTSFVGLGTKAGAKARIAAFFNSTEASALRPLFQGLSFWQMLGKAISGGGIPFDQLYKSLQDAKILLDALETYESPGARAKIIKRLKDFSTRVTAQRDRNFFSRHNDADKTTLKYALADQFKQPGLALFLPTVGGSGRASLADWATALTRAENAFALDKEARKPLLAEAEHHLKVITFFRDPALAKPAKAPATVSFDTVSSRLASLSMWGHGGEVAAEVKVSASATATPLVEIAAKAGVTASASIKRTHYRMQHFARRASLRTEALPYEVFTQDTAISYRQCIMKGEAAVTASIAGTDLIEAISGEKVEKSTKRITNILAYESAHAVWCPPGFDGTTTSLRVGSGLTFGHSISQMALRSVVSNDAAAPAFLSELGKQLSVTMTQLAETFEGGAYLADSMLPVEALLIEATFVAGVGETVKVKWDGIAEPKLDGELRTTLMKTDRILECIRIRYRIADTLDSGATFKLGVPIGVFKAGIELTSVAQAGSSGIVDLYAHWFGVSREGLNGRHPSVPEDCVPAAILLHQ